MDFSVFLGDGKTSRVKFRAQTNGCHIKILNIVFLGWEWRRRSRGKWSSNWWPTATSKILNITVDTRANTGTNLVPTPFTDYYTWIPSNNQGYSGNFHIILFRMTHNRNWTQKLMPYISLVNILRMLLLDEKIILFLPKYEPMFLCHL